MMFEPSQHSKMLVHFSMCGLMFGVKIFEAN